jgi:hypothetical protein
MKKYLLPLILIFALLFVSVGECAWLDGYTKRIKLTTDHTKIDSTLTNFPVTVFFTAAQGEEIFSEFDADSDYMKCAFTGSSGTTQLYAERELFDHSASKAIYHVSLNIWELSSSADTDFYFYYNNSIADNTTYIGATNTTPAETVWSSNFRMVHHMVDATTSSVYDSTNNSVDGTKAAANEPIEATGKVHKGQDFDGTNDDISITSQDFTDSYTLSLIANFNDIVDTRYFIGGNTTGGAAGIRYNGTNFLVFNQGSVSTVAWTKVDAFVHFAAIRSGTNYVLYINGSSIGTSATGSANTIGIHDIGQRDGYFFDGIIDEIRLENNNSAAYVKATYNSLFDSLLTYGSEETSGAAEDNAIFFGINF